MMNSSLTFNDFLLIFNAGAGFGHGKSSPVNLEVSIFKVETFSVCFRLWCEVFLALNLN